MSAADDARRWLRDHGAADHVVERGVAGLLARWERVGRELEGEYAGTFDDWLNDLDGRELLFELVQSVPEALDDADDARLAAADARVRANTRAGLGCAWGRDAALEHGWSPDVEWWYWTAPARPGAELLEELGDENGADG